MAMSKQKNDLRKEFIKQVFGHGGSFFCSLIAISYIELHTPLMGHVVVSVSVVEGDAPLFSTHWEPALSGTNLCIILRVQTLA